MVLKTPLVVASGPGGMGEYLSFINPQHIGAYILKTVTLHPKEGAMPPRIRASREFVINRIGLENPGIDRLVRDIQEGKYEVLFSSVPVIVSLGGDNPEEYIQVARSIKPVIHRFIAVEFNFSCPNVEAGGLSIVADRQNLRYILKEVREILKDIPLIGKFGIEGIFVEEASDLIEEYRWDGITLINTIRGIVKTSKGYLRGGISGAVLKPIGMRAVYEVRRRHKEMFIIASGGVYTGEDVKDYLEVGANAVQIGSALFKDPSIINEIYTSLHDK